MVSNQAALDQLTIFLNKSSWISGTDSVRSATIRRSGAPLRTGMPFKEPSEVGIPVMTPTPPPVVNGGKHKKVEKKPSIPLGMTICSFLVSKIIQFPVPVPFDYFVKLLNLETHLVFWHKKSYAESRFTHRKSNHALYFLSKYNVHPVSSFISITDQTTGRLSNVSCVLTWKKVRRKSIYAVPVDLRSTGSEIFSFKFVSVTDQTADAREFERPSFQYR